MQCFSVLWARRPSPEPVNVWYVNTDDNVIKTSDLNRIEGSYRSSMENLRTYSSEYNERAADERETVRRKAEKHQQYYRSLLPSHVNTSEGDAKVSRPDGFSYEEGLRGDYEKATLEDEEEDEGDRYRSRRIFRSPQEPKFNRVKMLKEKYMEMLDQNRDLNNLVPPTNTSGYSTAGSDDERDKHWCGNRGGRVERCASSDSAVGLTQSDDETVVTPEQCRINSGYQADNEYYSPYSPRGSIDHSNVPTKTIIEAQYVPFPIDRKYSDVSEADFEKNDSRRQSTFTDDYDEQPRSRYYRTPSVVVSDYSDDVIGLTLEDIEFFRNQRRERSSSPDSSLHSSCSNLNYVGSTISTLDAEYIMRQPFRKSSDCSTCSTGSGDENDCGDVPCNSKTSGWRKLRNIVQWTPFFQTYKKHRYPWVQLAGHQGNFKAGPDQGTILKKLCAKEERCFKILMSDVLKPYVPEFRGLVSSDDGDCSYLQLQDLLGDFVSPCVMDCKIGVRTYLEEELAKAKEKPKLRKDMYDKMCQIDKDAPADEEHRLKGVTKPRYMVWRETISSTATLGFRIEGLRRADGTSSKDFKTTKTKEQIIKAFRDFTDGFPNAIPKYIQRLKAIKATLESSQFFATHEVIGSSLLFVHDRDHANIWLIDFAKTVPLPDDAKIDHNSKWVVGNHEDGYLIGVNNLISIFVTMLEQQPVSVTPPPLITQDEELGAHETVSKEV